MDKKVFISRQSRQFCVVNKMIKVFSTHCTLTWRVDNHVSRQGKGINKRNENIKLL